MRTRDRFILAGMSSVVILGGALAWQYWPDQDPDPTDQFQAAVIEDVVSSVTPPVETAFDAEPLPMMESDLIESEPALDEAEAPIVAEDEAFSAPPTPAEPE